ncbi:MAG: hypothetical protein EOM19_02100 [Candidatus Moranbacteria bacterium]|nr:hypothetical protein [Candidatus Moranbacteria bacterium]
MLNQAVLAGQVKEIDKTKGVISINIQGEEIPINIEEKLMKSIEKWIEVGTTVAVKASVHFKRKSLKLIGERVAFLGSNNAEEN